MFYCNGLNPTPLNLAQRAWALFEDQEIHGGKRILEPSAGTGDLLKGRPRSQWGEATIHVAEIDMRHHPALRDAGYPIVGLDFLSMRHGAQYSHVIMNPPFAQGAQHVLHAWNLLWEGEIVAILNAETLRNPCDKHRQLLASLIEQHQGRIEYAEETYLDPDTLRKTDVEVALVHLRKLAQTLTIDVGALFASLKEDASEEHLADDFREEHPLAIKGATVRNAVRAFQAATEASKEAIFAKARAARLAGILGQTLAKKEGEEGTTVFNDRQGTTAHVQAEIDKEYQELKDRAWTSVLFLTDVEGRVTEGVRREIHRRFDEVKTLEFSVENIYGFLEGLVAHQGQLQTQMLIEIFDEITRYHSENRVWYKGWKSNDAHHKGARRIRKRRFVLPGYPDDRFVKGVHPGYKALQMLNNFDKAFAFLDGKTPDHVKSTGLEAQFRMHYATLCRGKRITTAYFDLRYYPGAGTIHFFPRSQNLIDRLNLLVGRARQWLPPEEVKVSEAFWLQYQEAETFAKDVEKGVRQRHRSYRGPSEEEVADAVLSEVLEAHGYDVTAMLGHDDAMAPDEDKPFALVPLAA